MTDLTGSLNECAQCYGEGEYYTDGECHECFACKPRQAKLRTEQPQRALIDKLKKLECSPISSKARRWVPLVDVIELICEHQADESKDVVDAVWVRAIAEFPVSDPKNMDAHNMKQIAIAAMGDAAARPTADRGHSEESVGGGAASPASDLIVHRVIEENGQDFAVVNVKELRRWCGIPSEISVSDDTKETIRHGLNCAEIFLLKHCHQPNAATILNAVIEARAALLSVPEPVSVKATVQKLGRYPTADYSSDLVKQVFDAAGVKYHD